MNSKISILGLYQWSPAILEGLTVPEGLERNTLIDYILMECADLELLYSNFDILRSLITSWAAARQHSWERLYQSTVQQYNMIHNYDRYEDWDDTGDRAKTETGNASQTNTGSASDNRTVTPNTTVETKKAAYNETAGYVPVEQVRNTGSTTDNNTHSDSLQVYSNATRGENEHQVMQRTGHAYGNIGVTTPAQMLSAERELYKWDVYAAITQEFKERFCVLVY